MAVSAATATLQRPQLKGVIPEGLVHLLQCAFRHGKHLGLHLPSPFVWTPLRATATGSPSMTNMPRNFTAVLSTDNASSIGRDSCDGTKFSDPEPLLCIDGVEGQFAAAP